MKKDINKFIFWTPRILSVLFVAFLALMSLDVFSPELSLGEILVGLLMHNIPTIILLALLVVSWKYEVVGGITFILAGILYIVMVLKTALNNSFEWYMLAWVIQISGVAFFIGILFLVGWSKKKKAQLAIEKSK